MGLTFPWGIRSNGSNYDGGVETEEKWRRREIRRVYFVYDLRMPLPTLQ
jgi:hypothetical protein